MSVHALLFYLTIVLLPTQLGFHLWPDWALVLGRRIDYLSPTLFLTDITLLIMLLVWVVSGNAVKPICRVLKTKKGMACMTVVLILVGTNILLSTSPIISLYKWGKIAEFAAFGYYIYKTKPLFRYVALAFAGAAAYSSLIGITQFFLQRTIGGVLWFLGERSFDIMTPGIARTSWCWLTNVRCSEFVRPYATFPHPNVFGGYLAAAMTIVALAWKTQKGKWVRLGYALVLGVSFVALLLTVSRSAWSIGLLAAILLVAMTPRKLNKKTIIGIALGLLICVLFALPYYFSLTLLHESVFIRYDLMRSAFQLFTRHPVFGTGLGTFLVNLPSVAVTRDLFFIQPVHNIYLLWLVETGIAGLLLVGCAAKKYISYFLKRGPPVSRYLPLVLLLLVGLVDHYPVSLQQGQLLLALCITLPFLNYRNT